MYARVCLRHVSVVGGKTSLSTMRKGASKIPGKEDILAQLEAQRAKQAEQLKVEAHARQELEDMLLRIERHFKVNSLTILIQYRARDSCCIATPGTALGVQSELLSNLVSEPPRS